MTETRIENVLCSPVHTCILRYLFASGTPIEEIFQTRAEREAAVELEEMGLVSGATKGRIELSSEYPGLEEVETALKQAVADPAVLDEVERLRSEHRE